METKRLYFNKLYLEISEPKISILLGARQVGKTTLMRQLEREARRRGYTTSFYDLEQSSSLKRLSGSTEDVLAELSSGAQVVFMDEFHYLENASKIFKAIYDRRKGPKIYASGSSSLEIHRHLKESLAGRFIKTMIFPLSLAEWNEVPGFKESHYLQWGGMPDLIHFTSPNARAMILENIVSTYITKDIKGLIQEENIRAFNSLLYLIAQSQGSVTTLSSLSREIGLSLPTVERHLEIMSQTYVLYPLMSYSRNMANELKKSKKYYLFDLGIRNSLLKDFRPVGEREDRGSLYEGAVCLLLSQQLKPNMELRFWRTKKGDEVDFILVKNRVPVPIEVKAKTQEGAVPKGMQQFFRRYPQAPFGIVFNETLEREIVIENRTVFFKKWIEAEKLEYLQRVL